MSPIAYTTRIISSLGIAGSILAALLAGFCIIVGVCFVREAVKRFSGKTPAAAPSLEPDKWRSTWQKVFIRVANSTRDVTYWVLPPIGAIALFAAATVFGAAAFSPYVAYANWIAASISVLIFGGAVGAAELVSRYKDNPMRAISTAPAIFYILLNALGSVGALYLIYIFPTKLGFLQNSDGSAWSSDPAKLVQAILVAGFASLLFFRTSLFKFRVGDSDLSVGPSIILDTLLSAADRAVDRVMAEPRASFVHDLMGQVSFDKAAAILPGHCIALMQNISSEESQRIAGVVNSLRADKQMPDKIKALNLGLALLTVVGEKVLQTAVDGLREDLQDSTAQLLREVASVMRLVSFDRARKMLPQYCFALWSNPVPDDQQDKLRAEATALGALTDIPEEFKALLLGIRLTRLTDGATLRKAVVDLGASINKPAPGSMPPMPPDVPPQPVPPGTSSAPPSS